jgi:hypothetical protein
MTCTSSSYASCKQIGDRANEAARLPYRPGKSAKSLQMVKLAALYYHYIGNADSQ